MDHNQSRYRSAVAAILLASSGLQSESRVFAQELMCCERSPSQSECDVEMIACDGDPTGCDVYSGLSCRKDIWHRETLTGDWCGYRSAIQKRGITFAGRSTHFAFGVDGGIQTPPPVPALGLGDTFKYTGRGEYDVIFDLEKFGGLPKGTLLVRTEHWYGEYGNVSLRTGAFPPAVFPAAVPPVPNDQGDLFLSNFLFT